MTYAHTLNRALMDMGMARAFQSGANFSGITRTADLYISMVVHKAFIDVAEEGTEAAAATGIVIGKTSAQVSPSVTFRADHPFVFVIKDNQTGAILFIGRVTDPTA
jgi:serpin B